MIPYDLRTLGGRHHYHTHFKDEEIKVQRLGDLAQITQEVRKPDPHLGPCVSEQNSVYQGVLVVACSLREQGGRATWGQCSPFHGVTQGGS